MCGGSSSWISTAVSVVGAGAAVASTVAGIKGAKDQAKAAGQTAEADKASLEAEAVVNDTNADIYERSAQSTLKQGAFEENFGAGGRLQTAATKSSQRASMAANGIDLGSDTATNILTTTDVVGEINANTIAANAVRTAWGYRTQETNSKNQANMNRAGAHSINPAQAVSSSYLTSASSIGSNVYNLSKSGIFNTTASAPKLLPWQTSGNVNPEGGIY